MWRVLLLVALSALDGWLTLYLGGLEIEGNPLMAAAMAGALPLYWVHKVGCVGLGGWVLHVTKSFRILWTLIGLFVTVNLYHCWILTWATSGY